MYWAISIILGLATGILAYLTYGRYLLLLYKLEIQSRGVLAFAAYALGMTWLFILAFFPYFVLVGSEDRYFQEILSSLIFFVFLIYAYIKFKKHNPEAYKYFISNQ